jgi:Zn-dependent protease with chaperone function
MYFVLGISLIFGCFYAVHLGASVIAYCLWRLAGHATNGLRAQTKANAILLLRIAPTAVAAVVALGFIAPAFLLYEPLVSDERVGYKLAVLAAVSAIGMAAAAGRIFASWWKTRRLVGDWLRGASQVAIDEVDIPAYTIDHSFPVLAIVGVFRPRLFIAQTVLDALERSELKAAIAHELGHIASRDNLKRVLLRICGDLLVFPFAGSLQRDWSESAELAADECAAIHGSEYVPLDLASALVRIGKLVSHGTAYSLPTGAYLLDPQDGSLAVRVERLVGLTDAPLDHRSTNHLTVSVLGWTVLAASMSTFLLLAVNNSFLAFIHRSTETVLAFLQ